MPRTVRLSAAVSLDGYIAGPNGEIDWILMDPDIDFSALMGVYDTVLMGRRSYEEAMQMGGVPMTEDQTWVFSRTLDEAPGALVSDDVQGTVEKLKNQPGKDIWLFGGGSFFRSMLDLSLVDEVQVAIIPVLLGSGVPLLPGPDRVRLNTVSHRLYPRTGTLMIEYEVVR